jgi:hypothetical protein
VRTGLSGKGRKQPDQRYFDAGGALATFARGHDGRVVCKTKAWARFPIVADGGWELLQMICEAGVTRELVGAVVSRLTTIALKIRRQHGASCEVVACE